MGLTERYSAGACLDFDLAVEQFNFWVEDRKNQTIEKPAPKNSGPPTVTEPKFDSLTTLLALDRDYTDEQESISSAEQALVDAIADGSVDPVDWIASLGSA